MKSEARATVSPDISIVAPSRGRADQLAKLLDHLSRQRIGSGESFEVVVGLDGYPPSEVTALPTRYPFDVKYLPLPQVGISAAKNAAVAASRGRVIIFVNDDIEPAPEFVHQHAAAQRAGHEVVLGASPWKRYPDQTVFDELIARSRMIFFYAGLRDGELYDFRHAWNLNLSVARRLLDKLDGPFSDGLRPVFYDDVEFAHRLIGKKTTVYYSAKATALHDHRYGFTGYFEREALLGVMAPQLHAVNPECFAAIFRCPLEELADQARRALERDVPDGRLILSEFANKTRGKCSNQEPGVDLDTLYAAHLPLKRRAFRCGLCAATRHSSTTWESRIPLARQALCEDPVFSAHATWAG